MKNILMICCLVQGLIGSVYAEEKKELPSIDLLIYAFAYAKGHQTIYLAQAEGIPKEVKLSNANILGDFTTVIDEERKIALRKKDVNEEGETIYPAIAEFKIPSNTKRPLLILYPADGDQPYKAIVVDHDLTDFPNGSYKFINFSPNIIRGLVGKTKVTAPSKKITAFNPSGNKEALLDVHFQYKGRQKWQTFGRTRWINEKVKRSLLCAYIDPRTKLMKIRGLVIRPVMKPVDPNASGQSASQ
jgi:hypothetical protein